MKDILGNRINKNTLVYWKSKEMVFRVADVSDGGLSIVSEEGRGVTPPTITLCVQLPVLNVKPGTEAQLDDFVCVLDPTATQVIEGMLKQ